MPLAENTFIAADIDLKDPSGVWFCTRVDEAVFERSPVLQAQQETSQDSITGLPDGIRREEFLHWAENIPTARQSHALPWSTQGTILKVYGIAISLFAVVHARNSFELKTLRISLIRGSSCASPTAVVPDLQRPLCRCHSPNYFTPMRNSDFWLLTGRRYPGRHKSVPLAGACCRSN
jgi:hypothetical protein